MPYLDSYKPKKLVKFYRNGLIEQEHFGFVKGVNFSIGEDYSYPFFMRSCAKPLQASLAIDYGLDFNKKEIALFCASHAGEEKHVKLAKQILNKIGLDDNYLKCGIHNPLSQTAQVELIKSNLNPTVLHNNCSGKHILMLALCKKNNWELGNYYLPEHPLQIEIKKKIYELCEVNENYPVTQDGCGVPICSMPLKNMLTGYLNLFLSEKYKIIRDSFLEYPDIIGGEGRLETKIMTSSDELIVKCGAGGICIVINTKLSDGFIVKITDSNMQAREAVVLETLKKLGWCNIPYDNQIKTLHNEVVGYIDVSLDF